MQTGKPRDRALRFAEILLQLDHTPTPGGNTVVPPQALPVEMARDRAIMACYERLRAKANPAGQGDPG